MKDLKKKYEEDVAPHLMKEFDIKNKMGVPKIEKVVVNTGFGDRVTDMTGSQSEKFINFIKEELAKITGQAPVITRARKSISDFGLQKGSPSGAKVTLRGKKMYDFLDRLIHIGLPRSRDFRGIEESSIDQAGNLNIGIEEHTAFPEASVEKLADTFGFQITVKTKTKNRERAVELFKKLEFPLK